jgi:DNA-binding winged helix-turn-helix (wHTH) protein
MQKQIHQIYSFDEFTLDLTRGCLLRETEEIKLRPKSFEVLKYLIENSGRLISKDELIESVWAGMAVTDDSLVQCLKDIRLALNDKSQTYIKTVPRRGYIFEKEASENGATVYTEETAGAHLVIEETVENGHENTLEGHGEAKTRRRGDKKLLTASPRRRVAAGGNGFNQDQTSAQSNYNSLQLTLTRRRSFSTITAAATVRVGIRAFRRQTIFRPAIFSILTPFAVRLF